MNIHLYIQKIGLLLIVFSFSYNEINAQCTALGQTPATAIPVCGTSVFEQLTVPDCTNGNVFVPGCSGAAGGCGYADINPFWYRFTCYQSGSLGLLIDPISSSDDYDWQIWDITGVDPSIVYSTNNSSLVIVANFSAISGQTGTKSTAAKTIECCTVSGPGGTNPPNFSKLPNIVQGHTYLLMISNFSKSQKGYKLSFTGGTAVITDPKEPLMLQAKPNCGADQIRLKLNKKMKCSSIAIDGSDILPLNGNINAISVQPIGCNSGFETDSVIITLSQPLPAGNYFLKLKNGADANTILDLCDRPIPLTDSVGFSIVALQPTKLDSIVPVTCSPSSVRFVFSKLIKCSSIDPSGSDFSIAGTYPVTITSAKGNCNADGLTSDITVSFAQPLQKTGNFIISLKPGFDNNTIIDECNQLTPPSQLSFSVKDTVNSDFNYSIIYGCNADTVIYNHPGGNGINSWLWNFGLGNGYTNQTEQIIYKTFGKKDATLIVSNGFCSDTSSSSLYLDNYLEAKFFIDSLSCPGEPVAVIALDSSERPATYFWNFGDGQTSTVADPKTHTFPFLFNGANYLVTHTITNDLGCTSAYQKNIYVLKTCRIDIPSAFTPNNDGLNDAFGPLNAIKAVNFLFRIYNRWGQMIFESRNWLNQWDGTYKGIEQAADTYVWRLSYIHHDTKKLVERKGNFVLIR